MKTLTLFAVAVVLGGVLGALFSWPGVALGGVIAAALGRWPHGLQLGQLRLLERMGLDKPLGIYVAGWRVASEHEPGTLRWSFEWIAPGSWALSKPVWYDQTRVFGEEQPYRMRVRRLELPLLGWFTLATGQDLLAAVEV